MTNFPIRYLGISPLVEEISQDCIAPSALLFIEVNPGFRASLILAHEPRHRSTLGVPRGRHCDCGTSRYGKLVLPELRRAYRSAQCHLLFVRLSVLDPFFAVSIDEAVNVFGSRSWHRLYSPQTSAVAPRTPHPARRGPKPSCGRFVAVRALSRQAMRLYGWCVVW